MHKATVKTILLCLAKNHLPTLLLALLPVLPYAEVYDPGSEAGVERWVNIYIGDDITDTIMVGPVYTGWLLYLLLPGSRARRIVLFCMVAITGCFDLLILFSAGMAVQDIVPQIGCLPWIGLFPALLLTAYFQYKRGNRHKVQ